MNSQYFIRNVPDDGVTALRSVGYIRCVDPEDPTTEVWIEPIRLSGQLVDVTDRIEILRWLRREVGPAKIYEGLGVW